MIQTILLISLASLGFRFITSKGMVLYFLRKPFDSDKCPSWLLYLAKPVILCSTCMASVHTLIWWPLLEGDYSAYTILVMLSVATINTIIFVLYEKWI